MGFLANLDETEQKALLWSGAMLWVLVTGGMVTHALDGFGSAKIDEIAIWTPWVAIWLWLAWFFVLWVNNRD